MRKIIVYIATSADGYIARPEGGVEWLDRPMPKGSYGMAAFYKSVDTVLMGRKTYDIALKFGQESYPGKKNYIFSRTRRRSSAPDVEFVNESVTDFVNQLRSVEGKNIWLVGGGGLTASFLDEGQIDEFIIHVIPVFIGEGIPLIQPRHRTVPLTLISSKAYPDGVVRLRYYVQTQPSKENMGRKTASRKRS
jgi:dihydrofolate reductase